MDSVTDSDTYSGGDFILEGGDVFQSEADFSSPRPRLLLLRLGKVAEIAGDTSGKGVGPASSVEREDVFALASLEMTGELGWRGTAGVL